MHVDARLKDRVAIVTGAAMGIGMGCAKVLGQHGARVLLADVNEPAGRQTERELRNEGIECAFARADVSRMSDVQSMVAMAVGLWGRIDVLVNNAGIGVYKTILDTSEEEWDRCLSVNLKGVFLCSKEVVPHMQRQGRGSIVNIASVHAYQNVAATSPYAASKGGIAALTRTMAMDFARDGIRVNAICPGWIDTPLIRGIFASSGNAEAMRKQVTERQVLGRLGTPEDVGYACLYLASDESSFVTGTSLFVDGGLTAQLETW